MKIWEGSIAFKNCVSDGNFLIAFSHVSLTFFTVHLFMYAFLLSLNPLNMIDSNKSYTKKDIRIAIKNGKTPEIIPHTIINSWWGNANCFQISQRPLFNSSTKSRCGHKKIIKKRCVTTPSNHYLSPEIILWSLYHTMGCVETQKSTVLKFPSLHLL